MTMPEDVYVLPASFGQERLWLLEQARPGTPVHNTVGPLRLRGPLDVDALRRGLQHVVDRHEVLRTVLRLDGAEVVQIVSRRLAADLDVVDVTADPLPAIAELATRPFDLGEGSLLRCTLLRIAPDDHVLVVVMHHAIGDARSTEVLLGELGALYDAFRTGRDAQLPDLPIQYADFAAWQRETAAVGGFAGQLDRRRDRLAGALPLHLPGDLPRPDRPTMAARVAPLEVPPGPVRRLRELGGGVTPFMVALAAYAVVLSRWSGQTDVVVALPTDGRDQPELEHLVGFFVQTLPVRVDLSGDPTFAALLRQVRGRCLEAYGNASVPFEILVQALQPDRVAGRIPLAQAWLVLQEDLPARPFPTLDTTVVAVPPSHLPFDVALSLHDDGGALAGEFAGSADVFSAEVVDAAAASFVAVLEAAATAPGTPVSELPMMLASGRPEAPALGTTDAPAAPGDGAPRTATEHLLVRLWAEILGISPPSVEDEFYTLGGNSLRAVRVVMRAREHGVELPVETVLGEHTIRQLARLLPAGRGS